MTEKYTFLVSNVQPGEQMEDSTPITQRKSLEQMLSSRDKKAANIEAMSNPEAKILGTRQLNALIAAVHLSFSEHRRLVLSPDAIWISIAQGFAKHINLNAEAYREHFVSHEGKKKIEIIRNHFQMGSPDNDWADCFDEFSAKIKEHIGEENHTRIVSDFSTTTPIAKAVSEITLMDAMQSYFDYRASTMCGIPEVTLEGTVDDWQKLVAKVEALRQYGGLDWWLNDVKVIVTKMSDARCGKVDKEFWQSMYKYHSQSGGPFINGWVLRLIPYVSNGVKRNPLLGLPFDGSMAWGLTTDVLPRSLSRVPFIWNYLGTEYNYEFIAGLLGAEEVEDGGDSRFGPAVRPALGWAVRPTDEMKDE